MSLPRFDTLGDAYLDGIERLLRDGDDVPSVRDPLSVASNFGGPERPAIELLGHGFEVHDPTLALLDSPGWQPRLDYYFALLTWSLAGREDTDMLTYYHPAASRFSDDDAHLSGAFGRRMFASDSGDQIAVIADRLRADPASRRAIALILHPRDNFRQSREYPCAASIQFFLRHNRLHAVCHMRAQQALRVLPYDAFLFMGVQSALAAELGVDLGSYRHFTGTFHIYADEKELARSVLGRGVRSLPLEQPTGAVRPLAAKLERWEGGFRKAALDGDNDEVRSLAAAALATVRGNTVGQAARVFAMKAGIAAGLEDVRADAAAQLVNFERLAGAMR